MVVGAGFDTLSARLSAQFREVNFIEVDQPATHEVKKQGIEALGDLRPNFKLLGVDLNTTRLEEVLSSCETWQSDAVSVVIAEGVLMYLNESAVSTFLTSVHSLTSAGSRLGSDRTLRAGSRIASRDAELTRMSRGLRSTTSRLTYQSPKAVSASPEISLDWGR